MCMDELSEIMYLVGQTESQGVPQGQKEKSEAIKIKLKENKVKGLLFWKQMAHKHQKHC